MRLPAIALSPFLVLGALASCTEAKPQVANPTGQMATVASPSGGPLASAGTGAGLTSSPPRRPGEPKVLAQGLQVPWALAFLPDGSALISERDTAKVKLMRAGGGLVEVGVVPGVQASGEGGLLGLAISPGPVGATTKLYAYLTAANDNRVVAMALTAKGNSFTLGEPQLILGGIPKASNHNGGRLKFGPDGMLYASTGDASSTGLSTRTDSLAGKILRLNPDGSVPADNPSAGLAWYSKGHRNVQGLTWDASGALWASEFGQNTFDELNLVGVGQDHGWPTVEGMGDGGGRFVSPRVTWATSQASPSGLAYAHGAFYMAGLRGERLWRVPYDGQKLGEPEALLAARFGRLREVVLAPDGASLWVLTNNTARGLVRSGDDHLLQLPLQ